MSNLEFLLSRHEGVRRFAYDDATGKPVRPGTIVRGKITTGVGRNLVDTGLSADEIVEYLCATTSRGARASWTMRCLVQHPHVLGIESGT